MRTRRLGKTGLSVSELTLGTWGLSGDGYGPIVEAEADRVIDRALELGVTLFDTADVYGEGAMERKLGERLPAATTYVCTKIGTNRAIRPPRKIFTPDYLREALDRSRERLKRDKIDIVLLHNPTTSAIEAGEAIGFLKTLKTIGQIGAWGVSAGSADVARAALARGAEVIELAYNAFIAKDLHELSGEISSHDAAVLARSVLGHGLLTGQWTAERDFEPTDHRRKRWHKAELELRIRQLDALRPLVAGSVTSLRAAALRFVLVNQLVSSAVVGPRSVSQLDHLDRDIRLAPPFLLDAALTALSARLQEVGIPTG